MSEALKLSDRVCGSCGRAVDDYGTCPSCNGLTYETGLAFEAWGTSADPLGRRTCPGCGRPVRTLETDGYCRHCSEEQEDEEELHERARAASRQGHLNSARLLRHMANSHGETVARVLRDEARKLEAQADGLD